MASLYIYISGEAPLKATEKAFLYVRDKRVIGCVVVEKISGAYPVIRHPSDEDDGVSSTTSSPSSIKQSQKQQQEEEEDIHHGGQQQQGVLLPSRGVAYSTVGQVEAALGIKQIWVSTAARRQGLARAMVDVARARFYYGLCVGKDRTAFSQLSTAGYSFATSYMKEEKLLLVY